MLSQWTFNTCAPLPASPSLGVRLFRLVELVRINLHFRSDEAAAIRATPIRPNMPPHLISLPSPSPSPPVSHRPRAISVSFASSRRQDSEFQAAVRDIAVSFGPASTFVVIHSDSPFLYFKKKTAF